MNKPQIIKTPDGAEMVVLPKSDYEALVRALEDAEDVLIAERNQALIASGNEELITSAEMKDYLDAPTPLAFWRKKRGLTQAALAKEVGVTQAYLSEIESGKKEARVGVLKELAAALKVMVDELVR
jgi:DNA-binding XRE family transcriptional regulator